MRNRLETCDFNTLHVETSTGTKIIYPHHKNWQQSTRASFHLFAGFIWILMEKRKLRVVCLIGVWLDYD